LGQLEGMFRRVFSNSTYVLTPSEIAFHLMEEVGEVSAALADLELSKAVLRKSKNQRNDFEQERKKLVLELSGELADVFSWTMSLIDKVRMLLSSFDDYFGSIPRTQSGTLAEIKALLGQDANKINVCDIIWNKYGASGELRLEFDSAQS